MNKEGYEDIKTVLKRGTNRLSPDDFERIANETGALVLDVRPQGEFVKAHIPRSIFIGLNGDFAPWVGSLIADVNQPLLLVCPEGKEEEAVTRLSRVGFDNTLGVLKGGFSAWTKADKEVDTIDSLDASSAKKLMEKDSLPVFDVRKESEFNAEHLVDSKNTPLAEINNFIDEFPSDDRFYIHCAGGYRSVIAASILKSRGIHNLIDLAGGFTALKKEGVAVTDYVCPTTL